MPNGTPLSVDSLIILGINTILNGAFTLWEKARQTIGADKIPEWDEISSKNARLQSKIDAAKAE